jgi:hypothetical protein
LVLHRSAELEDELLDAKEQVIDPLRRFMGGAQRKIYDEGRDYLKAQMKTLATSERPRRQPFAPRSRTQLATREMQFSK